MEKSYNTAGFTLIELLIAMAITGFISAAIFTAFQSQQNSYLIQDDVTVMQQNLRAGMDMMVREIRMAGYDPTQSDNFVFVNLPNTGPPDFGRYTASDGIAFYTDNGNGTQKNNGIRDNSGNEQIAFRLNVAQNGSALAGNNKDFVLRKYDTGVVKWQPLAENIQELEFFYTLADGTKTLTPLDTALIRSVQITMLARTERADRKFVDTQRYGGPGGSNWGPYYDNFRRRLLTTTVKCRNLGL